MPARIRMGPIVFALYPLLIFTGLQFVDPRTVALVVLIALGLRYRRHAVRLLGAFSPVHWAAIAIPPLLGLAVLATNSETLLRLYPAAISASMLTVFGATLVHPPTMIERFARLENDSLSPAIVRYTRLVTQAWCLFFIVNGVIAAYTAAFASREAWALYNGVIAYVLMASLFAGERLVRRRVLPVS